jgi:hypothetical protein
LFVASRLALETTRLGATPLFLGALPFLLGALPFQFFASDFRSPRELGLVLPQLRVHVRMAGSERPQFGERAIAIAGGKQPVGRTDRRGCALLQFLAAPLGLLARFFGLHSRQCGSLGGQPFFFLTLAFRLFPRPCVCLPLPLGPFRRRRQILLPLAFGFLRAEPLPFLSRALGLDADAFGLLALTLRFLGAQAVAFLSRAFGFLPPAVLLLSGAGERPAFQLPAQVARLGVDPRVRGREGA